MKIKKIIAAALILCLILSFAACATTEQPAQTPETPAEAKPAETTPSETNPEEPATETEDPAVQEETVDADPFGAYEEPITLTTIAFETLTQACPEGITLESNPYQDLWKSFGINVEYDMIAADSEDMPTKVNLAIASGEIPDFMSVNYATYKELREADMIADLTDVFNAYATEDLKELMYADGGAIASNITENGRLYGINAAQHRLLWRRLYPPKRICGHLLRNKSDKRFSNKLPPI